jgi:ABC-type multidrug transport system ATPase subunit
LLDEPSTGLDPASRRQLWDLINNKKKSCAMLLTTHAMEEADALCDRIGIFVAGELRCIGTSTEVKERIFKDIAQITVWKGL